MPRDIPPFLTRARCLSFALLLAALMILVSPSPGGAAPGQADRAGGCQEDDAFLPVLQIEGRLDAVLVDFIQSQVEELDRTCAVGLIMQLDSAGVVGETGDIDGMVLAVEAAARPVAVWVGPSGSRAAGEATRLLAAADRSGVAPGSHVEVTPELLEARQVSSDEMGTTNVGDRVGAERAVELGLADSTAPSLGDFFVEQPGVETRVVGEGEDARREPVTPVVFAKLPLGGQLMHTVASPAVAYLLLVIGLALLLFELYSAGVGVAGMAGAGCLLLASYGLASLPTNPLGLALILLAMFGYAVDVQVGVPRVWTGIATVCLIAGSLWLFDGLSLSWITLLLAFVGLSLFMVRGMPVMVRSRFSTPTIEREWLVGETGTAATQLAPEGTVTLRDAPWSARAKDEACIESGRHVTVVSVNKITLEVQEALGTAEQGVPDADAGEDSSSLS